MEKINRKKLIEKYLKFFESKNHKIIPSSPLIPENDPSVLFTTAGMHPLVPYLLGEKHPLGKKLASVQKCIRTSDIEEVGNKTHHTFFEMLGNWSLNDYWKKDAIKYSFEFLTSKKWLGLDKNKIAVSCFGGDKNTPKIPIDHESAEIWKSLGIPEKRIAYLGKNENWWGPAGKTGPCGPDTEMFYYTGKKPPEKFNPNDENWVEIWNDVFMQYNKNKKGEYEKAKQKNVDTGMGVERTIAILNNLKDNYLTPSFKPIIKKIEKISGKKYAQNKKYTKAMRIIADHLRASVFILSEDKKIQPSNTEQGYVLRRLIRRALRYGKILEIKNKFTEEIAKTIILIYSDYQELEKNKEFILNELRKEEEKFSKILEQGLKKFNNISKDKIITGKEAFLLFQSYGFPIEITKELANEKGIKIDLEEYNKEFKKHKELSKTLSSKKFKSGLADNSIKTKKLHTATHLLNEALRIILNKNIKQRGSNITPERLRFDFSFPRKLTKEEINKIEELVNKKIKQDLEVKKQEMPLKKALELNAQAEFGAKYPDKVYVYTILDSKDKKKWFSKEICTGPHVKNTKEISKFKITKEESVSAGIRRIKAVIEN